MSSLNDNPFAVLTAVVAPAVLGLAIGVFGVTGLVSGCLLMARETRFALKKIAEEAKWAHSKFGLGV